MMDYYELLELPRQAALEAETVRAAFQTLAAAQHPDHDRAEASRTAKFQALQEAYAVLSSTPRRLRHLLELHGHTASRAGVIDEALMPLFSRVHALLQSSDALLAQKSAATSALSRALLTGPSLEMESQLANTAGELLSRTATLHESLRTWDAEISPISPERLISLAQLWQASAFLEKWEHQLQQRRLSLLQ